ncbi:hypothetical protein TREMEDRAFT_66310 [Tremella mesenterica DSM 1558]|uniref:uncharacterized protein n=1 Tax=Tremella mesenterica (strain ATCC 24925 / CBS 8224 / DSM 1558 / NBRC 9311 / NRRL Y-6157 / RJB 2259-6 / UBC 559-6) TaxID=578456 RepID=UPI00032CFE55|nr:uncharacterized protein TREMEDRAFT_66310 [Tremella mesenterica DSM 1558]EIW65713.1 hypothetical protein TREMEDRAFT_66310 [Tremella mesenterica DSM 1558]
MSASPSSSVIEPLPDDIEPSDQSLWWADEIESDLTKITGPYGLEWLTSRKNDLIYANKESIVKHCEKYGGDLQRPSHVPDRFFPSSAAHYGLTRYILSRSESKKIAGTVKNFVCNRKRDMPTLAFSWSDLGRCNRCWVCRQAGHDGCGLSRIPLKESESEYAGPQNPIETRTVTPEDVMNKRQRRNPPRAPPPDYRLNHTLSSNDESNFEGPFTPDDLFDSLATNIQAARGRYEDMRTARLDAERLIATLKAENEALHEAASPKGSVDRDEDCLVLESVVAEVRAESERLREELESCARKDEVLESQNKELQREFSRGLSTVVQRQNEDMKRENEDLKRRNIEIQRLIPFETVSEWAKAQVVTRTCAYSIFISTWITKSIRIDTAERTGLIPFETVSEWAKAQVVTRTCAYSIFISTWITKSIRIDTAERTGLIPFETVSEWAKVGLIPFGTVSEWAKVAKYGKGRMAREEGSRSTAKLGWLGSKEAEVRQSQARIGEQVLGDSGKFTKVRWSMDGLGEVLVGSG